MIERDFDRAKLKADWKKVVGFLTGKPSLLLPFDLVRQQIVVKSITYEGIREVDLERVIGSVNRYHEFDREFLPKSSKSADRWSRVRQVFDSDVGFPPIKVYQIGEAYFVVDGNHRVSVARQLGMKAIEAEVVHFQPNVPIGKDTNLADLIIKKEYSDFLEQTHLDRLRPEQRIEFTLPGRYAVLLEHIAKRQYFLGLDEARDVDYEEAVTSWYDSLYRPLIEIFRQERLLRRFPKRTEADLYVWVTQHLYYLREQRGDDIGLVEATHDFASGTRKKAGWASRVRAIRRRLPGMKDDGTDESQTALRRLDARLRDMQRREILKDVSYAVPACWLDPEAEVAASVVTDPVSFWRSQIQGILDVAPTECIRGDHGDWSRRAVVYNLFVRAACAFDHDGDGKVHVLNRDGLRETGTFLKAIALLPYIRSLGCNVVHLLPVTRIGSDGRKGSLGSPYASANPYQLDETLSEPVLRLGPELEFRAFVEAAHRLGIRVVLEFVFRTAAKDSEWIARHPDWFYWVRADCLTSDIPETQRFRAPTFSSADLAKMKKKVERGELEGLPAPDETYRALFLHPPAPASLERVDGGFRGTTVAGIAVGIPGAFADWPPDDTQPPWGDVTYLRLYDHEDFNYMAYNTIRMYDARLARPENEVAALWDRVAGILPHYQDRYGIDGAMMDMGHALPAALKRRIIAGARGATPSFAFWDEEFESQESTRNEGYNVVAGNLWWTLHRPEQFRSALERLAEQGLPLPTFATPETHNTPRCAARAGGIDRSRCLWILGAFLPAIPFIHSGFELGEQTPVNTGLDFAPEAAARYPETRLPLYNATVYDWRSGDSLRHEIRAALELRRQLEDLIVDSSPDTLSVPHCCPEGCIAYVRSRAETAVLVVGNPTDQCVAVTMSGLTICDGTATDQISGGEIAIHDGRLHLELAPWQATVFAISGTVRAIR
jgi:starch synthase (maltosyl-transferring)